MQAADLRPRHLGRRLLAFTLVELLVVVSIIALLIAILMPNLSKTRRQASQAVCGSNLKQIGTAFAMYLGDYNDRYPAAVDPLSTDPFYWLWMGRGFRGFIGPYLVPDINKDNPSVLVCPDDRTDPKKYERTSYTYSMSFYHSPAQIDTMESKADTYSNAQPPVAQASSYVKHPGRKILCGEWESNHERLAGADNGWWDKRGKRVFLFADTHVATYRTEEIIPALDNLPDPNLTSNGVKGFDVP